MKNISHQRSPSLVLPRNFSGHEKLRNPGHAVAMYSRNALDSETINSPSARLTALILVKSEGLLCFWQRLRNAGSVSYQCMHKRVRMARFQNILETVGNTPVVKINKLAPPDANLYVKVEAFNPLGSVKDRLALGIIEAAERSGELKPGQTVIEATSGNTGIGLAMVCAQKGYPLVITMAETFSVERRKLMRFLGAKVVLTPAALRGMGMVIKATELAKTHGWFLTRQFENEANPDMHSRTTAREIIADFAGEPLDYWVTGYGTGGTLKGVARVLPKHRPETKIVVCEPQDSPLLGSGIEQARN